jgi:rod shape-determining protein MreD
MAAHPVTARGVSRTILVVIVVLLLQSTIGVDFVIFGAHPDFMLLLPIAAGLALGPEEGAVMGFVAGLAADLLLPTPFGLSALVGCVIGCGVGYTTRSAVAGIWWFTSGVALAASAVAVMLYAVLGAVLGQEQFLDVDLVAVVGVVSVVNAVLAPPAVRVLRWALEPSAEESRAQRAPSKW